jgi:hypothetical protein
MQRRPVRLDEAAEGVLVASARRVEQPLVGGFGYGSVRNVSTTGARAVIDALWPCPASMWRRAALMTPPAGR